MHCDPCLSNNVKKSAVCHCDDCNESLCEQCKKVHGNLKVLKDHKVRDIDSIPGQKERKYLQQLNTCSCSGQPAEGLEYFCNDHDVFCCGKCFFGKHRKCDRVDKIGDIVQRQRREDKKFDAPLDVLERKVYELFEIAKANTKLAEESYTDVEKRLRKMKQEIDSAYDQLKSKVLGDAKSRKQRLISKIQEQGQDIETLSVNLNELKADAEIVSKYGKDTVKHIFSHVTEKVSMKEINSSESRIRSALMPQQFTTRDKCNIDEIIRKLKDAIEVIDKDLVTGSDSHDSPFAGLLSTSQLTREPIVPYGRELTRRMVPGTRVRRGRDWDPVRGNEDGTPPGKGTIVSYPLNSYQSPGTVWVRWDCDGSIRHYSMDNYRNKYELQLADERTTAWPSQYSTNALFQAF